MGAWETTKNAAGKVKDTASRAYYGMYDLAARNLHPQVAGNLWLVLAIILFISDTGFFGRVPATQFNLLDFQVFLARGGAMKWVNLMLNPFVVSIIMIYFFANIGKVSTRAMIFKWVIAAFYLMIINFAGSIGAIIHLAFGFLFWTSVLGPIYGDGADRNFLLFLILDFFGTTLFISAAGMGNEASFQILQNLFFFPIWLIFITFNPNIKNPPSLKLFSIVFIVFILVFNGGIRYDFIPGLETGINPRGDAVGTIQTALQGLKDAITKGSIAKLNYATGGYYEGQVEKSQKEPLGVYIEDIKPADRLFYEDESVVVWANLKVKNLDEERPVNVNVTCTANKDKSKEKQEQGEILPENMFEIYSLEEEDIQCRFEEGALEEGNNKVTMYADFNFRTMAYLKSYFIEDERLRALRRDNIDVFNSFGIKDQKPVAKYTPGPVKMGIESKDPPVGISADNDEKILLGMTLSNEDQWQGYIKKLNDLIICVPKEMELDLSSCDAEFLPSPEASAVECGENHDAYKLAESEKKKEKYQNIKYFVSFRCMVLIKGANMDKVLEGNPFSTKFFRVTADYDYQLEKSTTAQVVRSPGFNVHIKPISPSAKDVLTCVGTHNTNDIESISYQFVRADNGKELTPKRPMVLPAGNKRSFEVTLPLESLSEEDKKKDTQIKCVMDASLNNGQQESDSSTVTIKNTAPSIEVEIKTPASSSEELTCNGTVKDIDGDNIDVRWEFREGFFGSGECKGLEPGKVCKTDPIPASELSAGEKIVCIMTPQDTKDAGSEKRAYVIISP